MCIRDRPPLSVGSYSYSEIPKCYGLLDQTALEVSGILKMQNQPVLALKGRGVLIGFIDTGIDYTNPAFRYSDGSSRIVRIWDQTIQDGTPPVGILYGADYTREPVSYTHLAEPIRMTFLSRKFSLCHTAKLTAMEL